MKKTVSNLLMGVNIVIVLLLLIASLVMIFMANTQQKGIFNYQIKIICDKKTDDKIGKNCLVFVKPNDTSKLNKGSYLLYTVDGISQIIMADAVNDNIISYTDKNGEALSLDTTSKEFGGRITFSNSFLGSLLSIFSNKENLSLTFILIGGVFIISMLSLIILYAIHMRKKASSHDEELECHEEMKLFDEDDDEDEADSDYVFGKDDFTTSKSIAIYDENPIDITDKPKALTFPYNVLEIEVAEEICFTVLDDEYIHDYAKTEDLLAQKRNFEKVFLTDAKEVATPPYYLLDDDVPSIDSLMSSIDTQFGFINNEDEVRDMDIKIFTPNK
ncbi:MAG: hypothetical protein WAX04_11470 [Oscillospiraceae bacterium]